MADKILITFALGGLTVTAYKLFSVELPKELDGVHFTLRSKERIYQSLHASSAERRLQFIEEARGIEARRHGHISLQYTQLTAYKARIIGESGDCTAIKDMLQELSKKAHVGEAVQEELIRLTAAQKLLNKAEHCSEREEMRRNLMETILRTPPYVRESLGISQ